MSRIGKQPITITSGVTATLDNDVLTVKGPKGELTLDIDPSMTIVSIEDDKIVVKRPSDKKDHRAFHGLVRSLIQNMVTGVTQGFVKRLEVNGVGYRFKIQGKSIELSLGYSHPINYTPPEGVEVKADEEKKNIIVVSGINKQKVGQTAAEIRSFRKPEPYKGKGIKYEDEYIRRKAGKTVAK